MIVLMISSGISIIYQYAWAFLNLAPVNSPREFPRYFLTDALKEHVIPMMRLEDLDEKDHPMHQ